MPPPSRSKGLQRANPTGLQRRASYDKESRTFFEPEEFAGREFPIMYKTKMIKKVGDYCYIFHCNVKGNSGSRFNKNMAVLVNSDGNICIVNPIRLSEEGEEKLLQLSASGSVAHILRMGPSDHAAVEDEYYLNKFEGCQRWAPGPYASCPHLPLHVRVFDTTNTRESLQLDAPIAPPTPHPDVWIFVFEETVEPECMLFLMSKRTLITGECLQCQQNNPFINDMAIKYLTQHNLMEHTVVLSERWVTTQAVANAANSRKLNNSFKSRAQKNKLFFGNSGHIRLKNDFQRLLRLDIGRLCSTSGNHVLQGDGKNNNNNETLVKQEITNAIERVFGG